MLLLFLWSVVNGCSKQETKFDRHQWAVVGDLGSFPYREQMLGDLAKHHQLKGLTYTQLLDSLGEPSNYGEPDGTIRYLIFEGFGSDIDPEHGKTLDLTLGTDSVVTSYKVTEW
ncbi:hypothetical protein [Hymenobacter jejuensis]|uniref:Uncharacterized protein n=1 Tax=Hymenobacter jejuensis TaxID=2502781 RepID=A0A5B7ZZB9_9BACT|nr:hypothetical protein [Hymenobacter jejuensis]QDA60350.1 hypothetical protein FHG12_09630 [Hymenobacter jejuensis]